MSDYIVDNPELKGQAGWICFYNREPDGPWHIRLLADRTAYTQFLTEEHGKLYTAYGYELSGANSNDNSY